MNKYGLICIVTLPLAACGGGPETQPVSQAVAEFATPTTPASAATTPTVTKSTPAASDPVTYSYTLTDLGAVVPYAIDDQNNVVGEMDTDNIHGFIYANGTLTMLPDSGYGTAHGVSNGVVVGWSGTLPAEWTQGSLTTLSSTRGQASAINTSGTVVGTNTIASNGPSVAHAMIWPAGTDLGANTQGVAINSFGDVAGNGQSHAFFYHSGTMTDIGTLQCDASAKFGSQAASINDSDAIVGQSCAGSPVADPTSGNMEVPAHAFLYANGVMTDLGTLGTMASNTSSANGINNSGEIVGTTDVSPHAAYPGDLPRAFLYANGSMQDLNALLATPNSGVVLTSAVSVNCNANVAASGLDVASGTYHAYLLVRAGAARC